MHWAWVQTGQLLFLRNPLVSFRMSSYHWRVIAIQRLLTSISVLMMRSFYELEGHDQTRSPSEVDHFEQAE
jgi:hypothetical protein